MSDKRVYFKEIPAGNPIGVRTDSIEASKEEIKEALTFKEELNQLYLELRTIKNKIERKEQSCNHLVKYDEPGEIYYPRVCAACGEILSFV